MDAIDSPYAVHDDGELPLFSRVNNECSIEATEKPVSSSENRQKMLMKLREGPLSTVDAETFIHRGQAVIGSLRERGYVIDTVRRFYHLISEPKQELVDASSLRDKYLSTPHWRAKAAERKRYDSMKCVQCGDSKNLETHHWRYELFNEDLKDLVTLCRICHEWMHEVVSGSGVHFPRWLPADVAERIERESR